jgi:hypothetical protein
MNRRAAVEPGIGHLNRELRLDRNRLNGTLGDWFNAIHSAAGMNFQKLLRWEAAFYMSRKQPIPMSLIHPIQI